MEENKEIISEKKKYSLKALFLNKYAITIFLFLVWMIFFDNASWLVIRNLDREINQHEKQLEFYTSEFEKNNNFYKKLMYNKSEKEKFARENYFMKRSNEEIFILVADTTNVVK